MPKMIFHAPYPLSRNATSASGIRPVKMRDAFTELGYEVYEVTGFSKERKRKISNLKKRIKAGETFDFLYSENATLPIVLTDKHRLPLSPLLDNSFFKFCRKHGIETGLFYRDIYWRQEAYLESVSRLIALGTRFLYNRELKMFRKSLTTVFIPSLLMAKEVPHIKKDQFKALPPGTEIIKSSQPVNKASLFYVGALGSYYRMQETVLAVANTPESQLIICTGKNLWEINRQEYAVVESAPNIRIVHASGKELEKYYDQSAIGCLFLEPSPYREFAVPMKLYEYLGHGKPIITAEGTLAGQFVSENEIGWSIPYDKDELAKFLLYLADNPDDYEQKKENVLHAQNHHTWLSRAQQVATHLMK